MKQKKELTGNFLSEKNSDVESLQGDSPVKLKLILFQFIYLFFICSL